jgi:hypothetical protein
MDRNQIEQTRLAISRIRRRKRVIDREIEFIREESRSYQRLGFGQDIKEIQLHALQDRRSKLQAEIRRLHRLAGLPTPPLPSLTSWMLLPIVLCIEAAAYIPRWARRALALGNPEPITSERTIRY